MSDLRNKIEDRMQDLELLMNNNAHINNPDDVEDHINSITKFWSILEDQDKDYIHACRWALDEKAIWKDDK